MAQDTTLGHLRNDSADFVGTMGRSATAWTKPFDCGRKSPPNPQAMRLVWLMFFGGFGVLAHLQSASLCGPRRESGPWIGSRIGTTCARGGVASRAHCLGHWHACTIAWNVQPSRRRLVEQVTAIQVAMKACRADRTAAMRAALPDSLHPHLTLPCPRQTSRVAFAYTTVRTAMSANLNYLMKRLYLFVSLASCARPLHFI